MDVAGGLSLVQTILQVLQSDSWKKTQSVFGVKSQLRKLETTMNTIKDYLTDADKNEQGCPSDVEAGRLRRLKEALYKADDLFDEVATLAHRKQLMPSNKFSEEVSIFFSRFNQLYSAFTWSQEIKKIREGLDDIVKDHQHLLGGVRHNEGRDNTRETHSYVSEKEDGIIGRDGDKKIVIDMLLDTTVVENVSFISIVGIGGLGKTTLAQLVYNDDKIRREFPLKMWVCVSDHFNVKALLAQILAAATRRADQGCLSLDLLQEELRKELDKKKYLLVLDDVWNEDSEKWGDLKTLLIGGGKGSRIVVTTRSKKVANVVGSRWTHELKGLSNADAWNLFQRMVLGPGQHQIEAYLVNIGQAIVGKCANVPLAIRVVGSLLRDQSKGYWEYIKNIDLMNIEQDERRGILPVLKISYYHLPFHLKSCFSYCAVFPEDHRIIKEDLIALWMAQGFIIPSDGKSFEAVGEECFMNLLQRCFFQDVERDVSGEIVSCKMHDLIHDLAKEVAGKEVYDASCLNEQPRHVCVDTRCTLPKMTRARTILRSGGVYFDKGVLEQLRKGRYLRVLDLHSLKWNSASLEKNLPSMIVEMLHLRYLDLSSNGSLKVLPMSIGQLYNLQTLKLRGCERLEELPRELSKLVNLRHLDTDGCKSLTHMRQRMGCMTNLHKLKLRGCTKLEELPRELSKLVNLRHLDTYGCDSLTHMPQGMNCMTNLHNLPLFVLGRPNGSSSAAGPGDLKDLNNLRDEGMEIKVKAGWKSDAAAEVGKGEYLIMKRHLMNIKICWDYPSVDDNAEVLLQGLEPPTEIQKLELFHYPGLSFPSWSMNFPKLVNIELSNCKRLEHLPLMSQLPLLKVLVLRSLAEVEYIESAPVRAVGITFFPSLEMLILKDMPKLREWWKKVEKSAHGKRAKRKKVPMEKGRKGKGPMGPRMTSYFNRLPLPHPQEIEFSELSDLEIEDCPQLTTFPRCRIVEAEFLDIVLY